MDYIPLVICVLSTANVSCSVKQFCIGHYTVVPSSDNNDNSVSAAVISGAIVGTLLLIIVIIIIIIIVIMLLCRGRKKSMKVINIVEKHNPPHNTSQDDHTDNNESSQLRVDLTSRLETVNALYIPTNVKRPEQHGHDRCRGDMIGRDVIITPNPSYIASPMSLQTEKQSEYSYAYVQADDKLVQHNKILESTTSKITDPAADNVKVDPNPSYYPLQLEDNPSYHQLQTIV